MKKFLIFIGLIICFIGPVFANKVLQTGVEIKNIPNSFYGNWRVSSVLVSSSNDKLFKQKNIDIWNLSQKNNVIKLENPFSGAKQSVTVKDIGSNFIKFTKVGNYYGKQLTDVVSLNLEKDTFWGVNEIKLETISDIDGSVLKTDYALYDIKGEKISGTSFGE
jgi:hypothetical protein